MEKENINKKQEQEDVKETNNKKKVSKKKSKRKFRAFTLIELLAVIIIIGILMIIAIPSVTEYINNSRKSAYIDSAKSIVGGARNLVNQGTLEIFDTNTTYYIPAKFIKTENGLKSPYGNFTQAYIGVVFDGNNYRYFWISNDETGQGIDEVTPLEKLEDNLIEPGIKDIDIRNKVETTAIGYREKIVILGEEGTWEEERIATKFIDVEAEEAVFLTGKQVNVKMKELAGDDTSTATNPYSFSDENIVAIQYSDIEPSESNKESKNIVSTKNSMYPIYMWYENGTIYWWSKDVTPALNEDASYMFSLMRNLSDISGLEKMNTSMVKNLSNTFYNTNIQTTSSLQNWDTSNVTTLKDTFFYARSLTDLSGLRNWNTSKVKTMSRTFSANASLQSLNGLEGWDVSKVTDINYLFSNNKQLTDISALENWNVSNVTNMSYLFTSDKALVNVSPIKNWNVSKVTTMYGLFYTCYSIEEVDLSNWDTRSLINVSHMFGMGFQSDGTTGGSLKRVNLSGKFNTSKVTDMSFMFYNNRVIEDYSFIRDIDTSSVVNLQDIFYGNFNLTDLSYFENWDVSKVTNMMASFTYNPNIQSLNGIENWDVSSVTDMSYMFSHSPNITDASALNNWNISNVADFSLMFYQAKNHPEFTRVSGTWNNKGTFTPN